MVTGYEPGAVPATPRAPRIRPPSRPAGDRHRDAPVTVTGLAAKAVLLGLVAAIALWAAFPLVRARAWWGLAVLVATTLVIFAVYLSRRHVPAKYLLPGTRLPGSAEYALTVATTGDAATGELVFLLHDPATGEVFAGDADGLTRLPEGSYDLDPSGRVSRADGYTVLTIGQAGARSEEVTELAVPTERGAILAAGLSRAYEGSAQRRYDAACDCIVDLSTRERWVADNDAGSFVSADGQRLAQGWRVTVGWDNLTRVLTDPRISGPFLETVAWNFGFAF